MLATKWAPHWIILIVLCAATLAARARADTRVNTENQQAGVAPRLEFELGPEFAVGLGGACRPTGKNPIGADTEACMSTLALPGIAASILLRPANHFAFGVSGAYDLRFGAHHVRVPPQTPRPPEDSPPSTVPSYREAYSMHGFRLAGELRWYSRRIVAAGFFAALQAGFSVWKDTWSRPGSSNATASQTAPLVGLELGGAFIPYRGIGMAVAAQARVLLFSSDPKDLSHWNEQTFGYGPLVFFGLAWRLAYGVSF